MFSVSFYFACLEISEINNNNLYSDHLGGFVRVKYLGERKNDRARMAYIEYVNNPINLYEKNEFNQEKERLGLQSFWQWEKKILKQEVQYFKQLLNQLDS